MRSRDGNRLKTLAICQIAFCALLHGADTIISYRLVVQDAIILNDYLSVSHAMTPCHGTPSNTIYIETNGSKNLHRILENNPESFSDFIAHEQLQVSHKENTTNAVNHSRTILQMAPTCFAVDFNEDFVKISPLK